MKKLFYITVLLLWTQVFAFSLDENEMKKIALDPMWLKLLHYDVTGKSSVRDKSFFLDEEGAVDAQKELKKTLEAYSVPFDTSNVNQHPRCRFPARYFWLSSQIDLPNYSMIETECSDLENWKLLKQTDSISVVFVSGYLGNPASAFGHSFIKINQAQNKENDLFDTSISYGALLPEKYNMAEYILRGLFGGYQAAYSDKYYYNQDVVYSNHEFRDMWEYGLTLSNEKKTLFLLHAWELIGKKFQYFFLNRNCGYKVSEFLGVLYDEPLIKSANIWYAPIETFYRLKELDAHDKGSVIKHIKYIPSAQQTLYEKYKTLSSIEKKVVEVMIDKELKALPKEFSQLNLEQKSHVFEFLLRYFDYDLGTDNEALTSKEKEYYRALLLERLKLPINKKSAKKRIKNPIITDNNEPSYVGLGLNRSEYESAVVLKFSPFAIEKEGQNHLQGDELITFDTTLALQNNHVYLKSFDLIQIQRLKTKQMPFDESDPFSWNLHIGSEKEESRDNFVDFGMGMAWDMNEKVKLYTMLNLSAHTQERHYRYMPNIGLYSNLGALRFSLGLGYEKDIQEKIAEEIVNVDLYYSVKEDLSFFVKHNTRGVTETEFGFKWYYH
ncbi:MAG TPA: DUF4105 domain-containing protein [Campylobacterales bacterium]|nr:DUF4105 domain-containing protein [Campylobacterales bacterium]